MEGSMPDIEQVRTFLRTACDGGVALDALEATYVQAGADGPVRMLYEIPDGNGEVLRLAARRVGASKGRGLEEAINGRSSHPRPSSRFTRAALYAPALDLLFQVFPADDRLPSLGTVIDAAAMTAILQAALVQPDAAAQLRSVAVHVKRYKPERKCLLRFDLAWEGDGDGQLPRAVWGRVARRSKFERTRTILSRVHAAAVAAGGIGFDLPEPLGVIPDLALELVGPVSGAVLFASVRHDDFPCLCRRAGDALRRFHALPVPLEEVFDVDAQLVRLAENAVEFAWMSPDDSPRIAGLEREISTRLRSASPSPLRLIHRDFHGDNVLVADGRLALLDFEDCAMGEPCDDVGSNWAQLTWHVHKAREGGAGVRAARQAFLDGYLQAADGTAAAQLPTYAAMHCFLYAHQCLRHPQDAARHEDARAMLAACEDVLERGVP